MESKVTRSATVTFVFRGYGILSINGETLSWNKKATSFVTFGVINLLTDNNFSLPIKEIEYLETYTYIPGGGLKIIDKKGMEYKFSFKKKKDFEYFYNYLKEKMNNEQRNVAENF